MKHNTYSALLIIMAILFNVSACWTTKTSRAKSPAGTISKQAVVTALDQKPTGDFSESKMLANIGLNVVSRGKPVSRDKRFRREVPNAVSVQINKNAQAVHEHCSSSGRTRCCTTESVRRVLDHW